MYVEDVFIKIRDALLFSPIVLKGQKTRGLPFDGALSDEWSSKFIASIGAHIEADRSLSTKQCEMCLKMIDKIRGSIVQLGWMTASDINNLLTQPKYKNPPYASTHMPREVRHLGDNLLGFRFKLDDSVRELIKDIGSPVPTTWLGDPKHIRQNPDGIVNVKSRFDWLHKIWIVPVYRFNVEKIVTFIKENRFEWDSQTAVYLRLARNSKDKSSRFDFAEDIIVGNVCDDPILSAWITEVAGGVTL